MAPAIVEALAHAEKVPGTRFAVTDQDAADDIEHILGAFGPTTLALIKSEDRSLRALDLDGVAATAQNAATGRYPHYKRLYVITQASQAAAAAHFVAFLRSSRGFEILVRNGHWIP